MGIKDIVKQVHAAREESGPGKAGQFRLGPAVEAQMMARARQGRRAPDGLFHPSSMAGAKGVCPRLEVLRGLNPKAIKGGGAPGARLQRIFDLGHIIHKFYQNDVLGPAQILWGKWFNPTTREVVVGFQPAAIVVGDVLTPDGRVIRDWTINWWYVEPSVVDSKRGIGGNVDGIIVVWIEGVRHIAYVDLKSANDRSFSFLNEPRVSHVRQVNTYMHCDVAMPEFEAEFGVKRIRRACVFYINKDKSLEKEFWLDADEAIINYILTPVEATLYHRQRELVPPKLDECRRSNSVRAKECGGCSICFDVGHGKEAWNQAKDWTHE